MNGATAPQRPNGAASMCLRACLVHRTYRPGQHLGPWRGLPATGAQIALPLCGIFTFDNEERLAGERIYYDRATLLRQLGVFHEPDRAMGRITTLLTHPLTMAQIALRKVWKRG